MPKQKNAASRGRQKPAATQELSLIAGGRPIRLKWPSGGDELHRVQQQAFEWISVVLNRARWATDADARLEQQAGARRFLNDIGLRPAELRQLASASRVEIRIPWTQEVHLWEARLMPWEYLLTASTRELRSGSLTVSRRLTFEKWTARSLPANPVALFVESAPGLLRDGWDFTDECRLVGAICGGDSQPSGDGSTQLIRLQNPTLQELAEQVAAHRPHIIHLAGFDSHQGLALLGDDSAAKTHDGYLLVGEKAGVSVATASKLAEALAPDGHQVALVTCNIWNSAARIAPYLLARGVANCVAIQDSLPDAVAESVYGALYQHLRERASIEDAFEEAMRTVQHATAHGHGTGIVLWQAGDTTTRSQQTRYRVNADAPSALDPNTLSTAEARKRFAIVAKPIGNISYALLHNSRSLFRSFSITRFCREPVRGLELHVELHAGAETYPYRETLDLVAPTTDLNDRVRLALTSSLTRSLQERLRSSLYVRLSWGNHTLHEATESVVLEPIDLWTDSDADRHFLPSFVFPRDAAVERVLRGAQAYVTALRDDPGSGFDGYQASDELEIDQQVKAIWYSLLFATPLAYINPPPSYTAGAQRVRTPSVVLSSKFGTCIDLALLLTACLEFVEIHPVMFLLNNHAFPGYWRSEEAREDFVSRALRSGSDSPQVERGATASGTVTSSFGRRFLDEIRRSVERNHLVPLETVSLTRREGFLKAAEEGAAWLNNSRNFDSMIDIALARTQGVTPLPLSAFGGDAEVKFNG